MLEKIKIKKREVYRYMYQGQEADHEIKGEGNSINYKYRMHDPRLGRFFAVDPLAHEYPYNSPYSFSENVVINAVELEGLEMVTVYNLTPNMENPEISHSYEIEGLNQNVNLVLLWDGEGNITGSYAKTYGKDGLKISDNTDRITNKEIKNTFNGITPKQENVNSKLVNSKSYQAKQADKAFNNGDVAGYIEWKVKDIDQGLEGEKGLANYAGALDKIGKLMKTTKLPIISQVGNGMQLFSLSINTGLDYKNKDALIATENLTVRLGKRFVDKQLGKAIDKTGTDVLTKESQKIGVSTATGAIKDELIQK